MNHAGFWRRFGAAVVDGIVVTIAMVALGYALEAVGVGFFESVEYQATTEDLSASASADVNLTNTGSVIWIGLIWLYHAVMESSARGATLGKRALGLRVTDKDGDRIGFGRASARTFAKILSAIPLLIGFAMAGFTKRKQALHDLIAGTLVLARSA